MGRASITVIGTSHMDFVAYVEQFPKPGETVIGTGFISSPGGKGANQAIAAARLGATCYLVSKVGVDFIGEILLENAIKNGVKSEFIKRDPGANSGVAVIYVNRRGENMIAVAPGVDHLISQEDVREAQQAISSSGVVLTQLEIPVKTAEFALALSKAMKKVTILNPAPAFELERNVFENIDFLTPNRGELSKLANMNVVDDDTALKAARKLIQMGTKNVVVTLGRRGAMLVNEFGHVLVPSYVVEPIDTVGAGDAFNGALAVAVSSGCEPEEAVKFGNLVAALKVTRKGAQEGLPTISDVLEFARAHKLEEELRITDKIMK